MEILRRLRCFARPHAYRWKKHRAARFWGGTGRGRPLCSEFSQDYLRSSAEALASSDDRLVLRKRAGRSAFSGMASVCTRTSPRAKTCIFSPASPALKIRMRLRTNGWIEWGWLAWLLCPSGSFRAACGNAWRSPGPFSMPPAFWCLTNHSLRSTIVRSRC